MRHEPPRALMALIDEVHERAVIGACLAKPDVFWDLSGRLSPKHFGTPRLAKVWAAMTSLADQGKPVTREMIPLAMADEGRPDIALPAFLGSLVAEARPAYAMDSCDAVIHLASRRQTIAVLEQAIADVRAADITIPVDSLVEQTIGQLSSVNAGGFDRHMKSLGDWADDVVNRAYEAYRLGEDVQSGLSSGLKAIDEAWGRMGAGRLYVLAGISGAGKSALARQIVENASRQCAKEKRGWGYVASLEMSGEENATRSIAEQLGIQASRIDEGDLSQYEIEAIDAARSKLKHLPVMIDVKPRLRMSDIRARMIRLKNQYGLAFAAIDHLLLVKPEGRNDGLLDRVSDATIEAKLLARELEIPVILLAQLNEKTVLERPSGKPNTIDLFGGQTIKQNADAIGFIHRPEIIGRKKEPSKDDREKHANWSKWMADHAGKAEFYTDKRRSGKSGEGRPLVFDGPTMTFRDI